MDNLVKLGQHFFWDVFYFFNKFFFIGCRHLLPPWAYFHFISEKMVCQDDSHLTKALRNFTAMHSFSLKINRGINHSEISSFLSIMPKVMLVGNNICSFIIFANILLIFHAFCCIFRFSFEKDRNWRRTCYASK